jgi:hypothetical protein
LPAGATTGEGVMGVLGPGASALLVDTKVSNHACCSGVNTVDVPVVGAIVTSVGAIVAGVEAVVGSAMYIPLQIVQDKLSAVLRMCDLI